MYLKGIIGILFCLVIACFGAEVRQAVRPTPLEREKRFVEELVKRLDIIKKAQDKNQPIALTETWGRKYHNLILCVCSRVGRTDEFRHEIPLQQFSVKAYAYLRSGPDRIDREYRVPNGNKMVCIKLEPQICNLSKVRVRVLEEAKTS